MEVLQMQEEAETMVIKLLKLVVSKWMPQQTFDSKNRHLHSHLRGNTEIQPALRRRRFPKDASKGSLCSTGDAFSALQAPLGMELIASSRTLSVTIIVQLKTRAPKRFYLK